MSGAPSGVNVAPLGLSMEPVVPPPAPPVDTMPMGEGVADAPPPPVPVEEDVIPLVDLPEGVSLGWV